MSTVCLNPAHRACVHPVLPPTLPVPQAVYHQAEALHAQCELSQVRALYSTGSVSQVRALYSTAEAQLRWRVEWGGAVTALHCWGAKFRDWKVLGALSATRSVCWRMNMGDRGTE